MTFDYQYSSFDNLRVTGRVRGTLYWDSLVSSGCARVTIFFEGLFVTPPLETRTIDRCGPGGDANSSANQQRVDESYTAGGLFRIRVEVGEVVGGNVLTTSTTSSSVSNPRQHPVRINSGTADFGIGSHSFGSPTGDASVKFIRGAPNSALDQLEGEVTGKLYWDSLTGPGCARIVIDFEKTDGTDLVTRTRDVCGPGGDANSSSNFRTVAESFESGLLRGMWKIRVRVGSLAGSSFVGVTSRTFDFNGLVGTFDLQPFEATAVANEFAPYALTWTVPEPLNWHDLELLKFRIRDESDTLLEVQWREAGDTFSLLNRATGRFGSEIPAGVPARLQTPAATLYLEESGVTVVNSPLGTGSSSPAVTLNLALSFKPSTAGRTLYVDVAASDDLGNVDPWVEAGTLTVVPPARREAR